MQGHHLLQSNRHLLHLAQDDSSLAVIRSSTATLAVEANTPPALDMQRVDDHIHIDTPDGRKSLELPGKAHLAHITGVHKTTGFDRLPVREERLRIHEDRLYQFDPTGFRWKAPEHMEEIAFNSLATGGNGSIYAQSDDVVVDLSSPFMPHVEVKELTAFSVAPDNTAALLSGKETQAVLLTDMSPVIGSLTPKKTKALELDHGLAQAVAIGLSAKKLFVADNQGRLYSADRSAFERNEPTLRLMPERTHYTLQLKRWAAIRASPGLSTGMMAECMR